MNKQQWEYFCNFKKEFKDKIDEWGKRIPNLMELQKKAALDAKTPAYSFETPIVYNRDLDKITIADDIRLIVIGDNPGKDEQLSKNNRYLVGQAGKIADGYFKKNPCLNVDFRKNVIILNKTPVHSAKTAQLKQIMKEGGKAVSDLILESQLWMAEKTALLQINLSLLADSDSAAPEIWLVGYSELKNKGFFIPYRDILKKTYEDSKNQALWNKVFVFQHFSMNRFTIDLNQYTAENKFQEKPLIQVIHELGNIHKEELYK